MPRITRFWAPVRTTMPSISSPDTVSSPSEGKRGEFVTRVPVGVSANRMHYVPSRDGQRFLVNTQSAEVQQTPITVVLNWVAGLKK